MIQIAKEEQPDQNENDTQTQQDEEAEEDYKERLLRMAAEFDNYKKRVKRDIDESERNGKAQLMKQMLPILDEFELALSAVNGSKSNVAKGLEMLYSNMLDALKREGLSVVGCEGRFNPNIHEIIMVRESEHEEGTILEVAKKGYMINDRLLRPASVIVSKRIEKEEEQNDEDNTK